jgi:serine/alanine adding enzyme
MSSVKIVRRLDLALWQDFVNKHPQGNIFHTPEMFQVFEKTEGHQSTLWAAADTIDKRLLALLLPVKITLINGPLRRLTTRAVAYGGVLRDPSSAGELALTNLLHTYTQDTKRQLLFTELRNLSDPCAAQPVLSDCGFVYEDHLNYLVDLDRSPEVILQSFSKRTRKRVRRELRRNAVVIEQVTKREQLAVWYAVLQQTYHQAQVPLADRSLFEATFDILCPRGMAKFFAARVDQAYAAVSVELLYKDVIYGWYGGMDRIYKSFYPNELLTWHILKWGAENGFRIYDFGGAGKPDEEYGVRDFKAKFGGELVCYGRNTYVHTPIMLQLSQLGYKVLRHFL